MQNLDFTCYIDMTSISSSPILNLIVGSLIFHSQGCRLRSHDYHESPKFDFFVYYPRLRFISLVLLFYAWHLCLAPHDIIHRSHLSLVTCDTNGKRLVLGPLLSVASSHVSGRYRYPRCIFCLISRVQPIPVTVYLNLACSFGLLPYICISPFGAAGEPGPSHFPSPLVMR
ncbi:uncharacterized protein N7487_005143 [Penicillium crustosum]|uniref:uncharacterized protein n=1 Tax=Penicillium crustosum TaxID=36656 RepID=UPI0023A4444C|nr:uncharacterized protein N7487_005143 [Penicillium crustosum]KAJ5410784.1 hypothetical protein N7487_005143 [Penicillium crustosum]